MRAPEGFVSDRAIVIVLWAIRVVASGFRAKLSRPALPHTASGATLIFTHALHFSTPIFQKRVHGCSSRIRDYSTAGAARSWCFSRFIDGDQESGVRRENIRTEKDQERSADFRRGLIFSRFKSKGLAQVHLV